MATQKTKKQILDEKVEQVMVIIPGEYKLRRQEVLANTDYSQKYKDGQLEKLYIEYAEKFKRAGDAVAQLLKDSLNSLTDERKEAMSKRTDQTYLLQLQNAMSTLELLGGGLSDEELQTLIQPFKADSIAMATLQKLAIKFGMDSERAIKQIYYVENPAIRVLSGLINTANRVTSSRVDADGDIFVFKFALQSMSDQLTGDLKNVNML